MTNLAGSSKKCAACGAQIDYTTVLSTNTLGSPDLDLRPAEMQRSTMEFWVVECPECRFVQYPSDATPVDMDFIRSGEYRSLIHALIPETANRFQRLAVSLLQSGQKKSEAAEAYTRAAWDCEDQGYEKEAVLFRERAADCAVRAGGLRVCIAGRRATDHLTRRLRAGVSVVGATRRGVGVPRLLARGP